MEPTPETFQFSITAVYMNRADPCRFKDEDDHDVLRGQYHGHPYGELNLVVPLNKGAELKGLQGWAGARLDGARSRQSALSRGQGGAVIALFYLPVGASPTISSRRPDFWLSGGGRRRSRDRRARGLPYRRREDLDALMRHRRPY